MSKRNTLAIIDFHGNPLAVITTADGQRLVAMRPICDAIGLDGDAQLQRIKRDNVLSSTTVVITVVAADGKEREQVCLPLEYLNGWLFGISTSRVKPEIRQRLEDYQRECYQVLNAYWGGDQVSNPRVPQQSEILVAQAYARAAEAADIVSRHVFQAVLNGQVDPYQGRWLLETRYAGPKRELVPSMRMVPDDALVVPVEGMIDALEDRLLAHFGMADLARMNTVCSSALMNRVQSGLRAQELKNRMAARKAPKTALATADVGSKS
ncbi:phage antirepressor N-terminal domain-containing protein [Alcaligenes nematophilus]|uniref:phage antirepressor N-terminal domain-containing protein n=1 Tax=Alcaligenes nematophilus TaxID=2994643 RepID=UPI0034E0D1B6